MKTNLSLLILVVVLFSCASDYSFFSPINGEGPNIKQKIELDDFTSLSLKISANVQIKQGDTQEVEIEAPANLIELLNRKIDGKHWNIKFDKQVRFAEKITIYITVKELNVATVSGSGSIQGVNDFKTDQTCNFVISGSGNIHLTIECPQLDAVISGSGNIRLNGRSPMVKAAISGSGNIHAEKLMTENVSIAISGSGDGYFNVSQSLKASIAGSGSVLYQGTPKIEAKISGSGKVKPIR
jgi:biopolymer transport protein ExbD